MFISPAYAQTAQAGGGDLFGMFLPMILIFAIMYFLLIRPQQKKQKQHQAKLAAVKRGDKVVTGGGIYGTVRKLSDEGKIHVEIAKGIEVVVASSTLADVLLKQAPQPAKAAEEPASGGFISKLLGGGKKAEEKVEEKPVKEDKPKKKKKSKDAPAQQEENEATESSADSEGDEVSSAEKNTETNTETKA